MALSTQSGQRAPRRFKHPPAGQESSDHPSEANAVSVWSGQPSVAYGVLQRLAHQARAATGQPYLRLQYADAGRRGDPWGGLHLEICGQLYHFGAGIARYPDYHDGRGNLTAAGEWALAIGLPGKLTTSWLDWRWLQDEVDLTPLVTAEQITTVLAWFQDYASGARSLPPFQSWHWAHWKQQPLLADHRNCTTSVAEVLQVVADLPLSQRLPLPLIDHALQLRLEHDGLTLNAVDMQLHHLLRQPEAQLGQALEQLAPNCDLNAYAKMTTTSATMPFTLAAMLTALT